MCRSQANHCGNFNCSLKYSVRIFEVHHTEQACLQKSQMAILTGIYITLLS